MLVMADDKTDRVHLMGLTWPEIFALAACVIVTADAVEDSDSHDLLEPLLDGLDAATVHALNEPARRAANQA